MGSCYNAGMKINSQIENAKYVYVSYSGGKDSTAMLLHLLELGEKVDRIVFADTGFEFPELYDYISKIEGYIQEKFDKSLKITILKPNKDLWDKWFYGKITRGNKEGEVRGFPLYAYPCWFSRESKIKQLQKVMIDAKYTCVGIAKDELERCGDDKFVRYPLVEWGWSEQDCVDYLNERGLMNPLYKNFNRVGCYFCPKQSEMSLWVLWKNTPDLWQKAVYWDKESRRVAGHGIKDKPLSEYQREFEGGKTPKKLPAYECFSCNAVGNAFKIRQEKLNSYLRNREKVLCVEGEK